MVTWADVQHVMTGIGKCRYEYLQNSFKYITFYQDNGWSKESHSNPRNAIKRWKQITAKNLSKKEKGECERGQITLYCWCWRKKLVSLKSCNELWVPKIYLSPGDVCANRLPTKTQIYKLVNQWKKLGVSHPNWLKSISDDRNVLGERDLYIFYGNVLLR